MAADKTNRPTSDGLTEERRRWLTVREIFDHASELPAGEQSAYLDQACAEDPSLRTEVEALLEADLVAPDAFKPQIDAAAETLIEPVIQPADRLGPYRIVGEIGRGGMGVVYAAVRVDGEYEQRVAVKIMARLATDSGAERFRNERQILADLEHPAIARLLDGGTTEDGTPYLVMELVEGEPIDEYCRRLDLGLRQRVQLLRAVCSAVAYAHMRLVVPRFEAGEYPDHQGRPAETARLRHRQDARRR